MDKISQSIMDYTNAMFTDIFKLPEANANDNQK